MARSPRLVQVWASRPDGGVELSSGFLVAPGLLLTPAHGVRSAAGVRYDRIEMRQEGGALVPCEVVWTSADPGVDVALLRPADPSWRADGVSSPVAWGRLVGAAARVPVEATGCPASMAGDGLPRDPLQLSGHINPGTRYGAGLHVVNLDDVPPVDGQLWRGISGAALLSSGAVLGVMTDRVLSHDPGQLAAVPVSMLAADPTFAAAVRDVTGEPLQLRAVELDGLFAARTPAARSPADLLRAETEAVRFSGREDLLKQTVTQTLSYSLRVLRKAAVEEPARYQPVLATHLRYLSLHLSKIKEIETSVEVTEDAVQIQRELAAANPDRYLPQLAVLLQDVKQRRSNLGQAELAHAADMESTAIYRKLADVNPGLYLPKFAKAAQDLALHSTRLWRTDGLAAALEAVEAHRRLSREDHRSYRKSLARSLSIASRLASGNSNELVMAYAREVTEIYEELAAEDPAAFQEGYLNTLSDLSARLAQTGQPEAALSVLERVVGLLEGLAESNGRRYTLPLTRALGDLAARLFQAGAAERGFDCLERAVQLCRDSPNQGSVKYLRSQAYHTKTLAIRLAEAGELVRAVEMYERLVEINRRLAEHSPERYLYEYSHALSRLATHRARLGRSAEASSALVASVTCWRELAAGSLAPYRPLLANVLGELAKLLTEIGQDAHAAVAVEAARVLAEQRPTPGAAAPELETTGRA